MTVPVPGQLTYSYDEDGVTTTFSYPVRFLEPQELVVVRDAPGGQARLTYNVDYTVSGAGHSSGGSITRTAVTNGGKIIISRDTSWKQIVDLEDNARNPAEAVELQLDRLTMAGQDAKAFAYDLGKINKFTITGGTGDDILASLDRPVIYAKGEALFTVEIAAANTGNVTLNGKPLRTNSGNEIVPGGLTAGSIHAFLDLGSEYRLLSDQASAAVLSGAEALYDNFRERYAGAFADDTAADTYLTAQGLTKQTGTLYFNSTSGNFRVWTGTVWQDQTVAINNGDVTEPKLASSLAAIITHVVADRTELKALNTSRYGVAYLKEDGREGKFIWRSGDYSAKIASDTAEGIYIKANAVAATAGAWVRKFGHEIEVSWFGAVGDAVDTAGTNDTVAWQLALLFGGGKTVCGEKGKTYLVTDDLTMEEGTTLAPRKSRINFNNPGGRCIAVGNFCNVSNGWIKNYGTTTGIAGDLQCPICVGEYAAGVTKHNVQVRNLTIENDWNQGCAIFITGGSYNVLVENIKVPTSPMLNPIEIHWGGDTNGTVHPHDIVVRNIEIGTLADTAYAIWVSGAYNITVENVAVEQCGTVIAQYCGDYGVEYADIFDTPRICKGINFKNITCRAVRSKGFQGNGTPYLLSAGNEVPMAVRVENMHLQSLIGSTANVNGIELQGCSGVTFDQCSVYGFNVGVAPAGTAASNRISILRSRIANSYLTGIYAHIATHGVTDWVIQDCVIADNNTSADAAAYGSGIYLGLANQPFIQNNRISGANQNFGVYASSDASSPRLIGNHVLSLAAAGVAYNMNSAVAIGGGNTAQAGLTLHAGTAFGW